MLQSYMYFIRRLLPWAFTLLSGRQCSYRSMLINNQRLVIISARPSVTKWRGWMRQYESSHVLSSIVLYSKMGPTTDNYFVPSAYVSLNNWSNDKSVHDCVLLFRVIWKFPSGLDQKIWRRWFPYNIAIMGLGLVYSLAEILMKFKLM